MRRQRPRVDPAEPDDAARLEPLAEMAGGPVIRRLGWRSTDDATSDTRRGGEIRGLDVLLVRSGVTNMWKGEGDDLAGIGGVGQNLLIAGHGGVEADLADGAALGTESPAFDDRAIVEDEQRRRALLRPSAMGTLARTWLPHCALERYGIAGGGHGGGMLLRRAGCLARARPT